MNTGIISTIYRRIDSSYCPDHLNRRKRSKEEKLEDWIKEHNEEINLED